MRLSTALICLTTSLLPLTGQGQVGDLLWSEEFDALDQWIIDSGNGNWGWGNGELQFYSADNVDIAEIPGEPGNNGLRITASQESGPGLVDIWGNPLNYTSGKVNSRSHTTFLYGMIEARVQVPDLELGGWPAIWMLGNSNFGWPRKGEIDMMEMGANQAFRNLHDAHNGGNGMNNSTVNEMTGANAIWYSAAAQNGDNPNGVVSIAYDPDDDYNRPYYNMDQGLQERFVTYRVYWDENAIRYTVEDEGIEYELFAEDFQLGDGHEAFHKPFYIIANMAIGGTYTDAYNLGDPNSGAPVSLDLPAEMYLDYIRYYEWNGQGTVHLGPPTFQSETYGIFTDETPVNNEHIIDEDAFIFAWEGTLSDSDIPALEGDNVMAWSTNGSGWFGAGVMSEQPLNLLDFAEGDVNFSIQIPANVSFQIGITDAWGNQNYVDFPALQTAYGLERDGEWGQASIPVDDIRGELIDLRMMAYTFVILEVNGASCEFAIDDVYWSAEATGLSEGILTADDVSLMTQYAAGEFSLSYTLPDAADIYLELHDAQGRLLVREEIGTRLQGSHGHSIQNLDLSDGMYIISLGIDNAVVSQKLMIRQ